MVDFKDEEKRYWDENLHGMDCVNVNIDYIMFDKIARHFRNIGRQEAQKKADAIETFKVSPFTGGKVTIVDRDTEVTFRGERVKFASKVYHCEDTGREYTDAVLDSDMMWAMFRSYCENNIGIESFADIKVKKK